MYSVSSYNWGPCLLVGDPGPLGLKWLGGSGGTADEGREGRTKAKQGSRALLLAFPRPLNHPHPPPPPPPCLVHIPAGGRAPLACPALCLGSTLNGEQEAPTPSSAIPYHTKPHHATTRPRESGSTATSRRGWPHQIYMTITRYLAALPNIGPRL